MAKSRRALQNELRLKYLGKIMDFLAKEEDVLRTGSNEIAFPVTDSEGNEEFIQIVVKFQLVPEMENLTMVTKWRKIIP